MLRISSKSIISKSAPFLAGQARRLSTFQQWTFPTTHKDTTPVFIVSPTNGFLPRDDPIADLPSQFKELNSLLDRMSLELPNGKPGLLAKGQFGDAVKKELPLYDVSKIQDQALLMALFR